MESHFKGNGCVIKWAQLIFKCQSAISDSSPNFLDGHKLVISLQTHESSKIRRAQAEKEIGNFLIFSKEIQSQFETFQLRFVLDSF